jgi:hypothetical protein
VSSAICNRHIPDTASSPTQVVYFLCRTRLPLSANCIGAGAVRSYDRAWIAAVLTGQVALGVILGVTVQDCSPTASSSMPAVGLGVLDLARGLADLELPMRLIQLFSGT